MIKNQEKKFAVIAAGGKQYLVREGETLKIERIKPLRQTQGKKVEFDQVLLVVDPAASGIKIGNPVVNGAKVIAEVEGEAKGKKITVFKYKQKTRYRIKKGHRQIHSKIKILEIKS